METKIFTALIFTLSTLFSCAIMSQNKYEDHRLYLLGNLDEISLNGVEFDALEKEITSKSNSFTILVNGDFVGTNGWSKSPKSDEKGRVDQLIALAAHAGGSIIFIPGDKEWDSGSSKGIKKVKALEKYIESKLGKKKCFFPQNGCLGPEVIDINDHIRVIAINSQWIMQEKRPEEEDANCDFLTDPERGNELGSLLSNSENKNIVVAIHHPLLSYGQFAGYKMGVAHLLPPIIGSFRAAHKRNIGESQEFNNFTDKLLSMSKNHGGIIFTSGHEYDLQVLVQDGNYHINSGALVKSKPVAKKAATVFCKNTKGIAQLNFQASGEVNVDILELRNSMLSKTFHKTLYSSPCQPNQDNSTPINLSFTPCLESDVIEDAPLPLLAKGGSGVASSQYSKSKSGEFFLGKLYRKEWGTVVNNIPYLDIGTMEGGLIPYARGGAGETTSLKFKTKDGRRYAFRSVDKNPQRKIKDKLLKNTYGKVSKDLIAHQHPYGAIAVKTYLDKLDLPHSDPTLYIMPDDPRLGIYQEEFAGMLGTFEVKPRAKKKNRIGYQDADEVSSTFEVYANLLDDNRNKVEAIPYLRARLFDIWMADWDRHESNWAWLGYEEEKGGVRYKVFPKDKDKVMGILSGLYKIIDWEWISPSMAAFRKDYRGLKSLNFKSRNMDRWILSEVTHNQWIEEAENLKKLMTDEVLDQGLANMPPEVQIISAQEIKRVLKLRRDLLPKASSDYFKLLSKNAFVIGSNKKEAFNIIRKKNGDVHITVSDIHKDRRQRPFIFDRVFKKSETEEIRIYGLGKDDRFTISGETKNTIKLRIIGGSGEDKIVDKSIVGGGKSTYVYDYRGKDTLNLGTEGKLVKTNRTMVFNSQNIFNYDYAVTLPKFGYNTDDGFVLGFKYTNTRQGFGKRGFSSKASLKGTLTSKLNFNLAYQKTFRLTNSSWDLIFGLEAANNDRAYQRFFGFGNESIFDNNLNVNGFYRNKTNKYLGFMGFEKEFWGRSYASISLRLEHNNVKPRPVEPNSETIYDNLPTTPGLGSMFLGGPQFKLDIDLTDNAHLPTHGVKFKINSFSFFNNSDELDLGGRLETDAAFFLSVGELKPITLSLRAGYSKGYGDTPFYYKSTIGQQVNHRGFSRNRFAGDSAGFLNSDIRFLIGSIRTPLFPVKYGILGLFDTGRVWSPGEESNTWHNAWGGGFYLVPWRDNYSIKFIYAKTDEGNIIDFGLGVSFY